MKTKVISGVTFYHKKSKNSKEQPQQYAMDIANECNNQVMVKYGQFCFGSVFNYDELAVLIDKSPYKDRLFYELVTGKQRCFADIDGEYSDLLVKTPEPYFKSVYCFLEQNIPDFDPSQLFILNSSTKEKLSLHINYNGVVFENNEHQKPFWQDAIRFFEDRHMGCIKERSDGKFDRKSVVDV